ECAGEKGPGSADQTPAHARASPVAGDGARGATREAANVERQQTRNGKGQEEDGEKIGASRSSAGEGRTQEKEKGPAKNRTAAAAENQRKTNRRPASQSRAEPRGEN